MNTVTSGIRPIEKLKEFLKTTRNKLNIAESFFFFPSSHQSQRYKTLHVSGDCRRQYSE